MFKIIGINYIPKIGTLASCYSEEWDKMTREEVAQNIAQLKLLNINGIDTSILDYSVDLPFSGGINVTFRINDDSRFKDFIYPITIDL